MASQGDRDRPPYPDTQNPSRSPSLSPTPAVSSCPSPDRTFSTMSTVSSVSNFSGDAKSGVSSSSRRRGYIRPQGVEFAESAKNRESVMSLGSIAHLQYYFARTGLLDGKGAQFAKANRKKGEKSLLQQQQHQDIPRLMLSQQPQLGEDFVESPIDDMAGGCDEMGDDGWDENEPVMLPPTVSTYSIRNHYIPPPPDLESLRRELQTALAKARFVLTAAKEQLTPQLLSPTPRDRSLDGLSDPEDEATISETPTAARSPRGWHEIEGMHILDVVTFAIRAAKIYYTAHENPERLASIKSERKIREELLQVLEVLKKWATRNFAGGLRDGERASLLAWIAGVGEMLDEERKLEEIEMQRRSSFIWANGEWDGREREQAGSFLQCLETSNRPLPAWDSVETNPLPTPLLARLKDGRDLVRFHNEAVKLSHRQFGQIKSFHEDVAKPYRLADNLRYWVKAAEIRWEIKLELDVMAVVNGEDDEAWKSFDTALMAWCKRVREELVRDWKAKGSHSATLSPVDPGTAPTVAGLGIDSL
ncbi:conserved hypothetical protein [Histoplasma capsulatum G186AR]|uniref:Uncharacterized protein n=2 Tax=Ajellomyces capsulatus TaxID=5037 RepID=C0NCR7_AJECG|nr:uncharacterized protein HCBG_00913 [Histoplasma capsulatum G186AR]EEH11458.1 conserved hypothetical protein [Histoplasma capsulatum G186AR]KAG5302697.1 hypothetical protein I7I52_00416 [Histoplasma capsulatum]QSS71902.1 hypothetical protein I7I50_02917 [Histoplasma capsulatum G186AR]